MTKRTKSKSQTARFFRVKNFEKFQHYKKRCPPWVKLYYEILDDEAFIGLPLAARHHYLILLLIAGRRDNVIPLDENYLKKVMRLDAEPDLKPLFDSGFLLALRGQDASKALASRKQVATPELYSSEAKKNSKRDAQGEERSPREGEEEKTKMRQLGEDIRQGMNGERANQAEKEKAQDGGERRATDEDAFRALEKIRATIGSTRNDGLQPIGNPLKAFQHD